MNPIFKGIYFFWLRNRPLITYATGGMEGGHPKYVQVRTGGGVDKSVMRYIRTKWMASNKCYRIIFVQWFGQVH